MPHWSNPICGSARSTTSPFISNTNRKTPWAAGCWGPKFKVKFLICLVLAIFNHFFFSQSLQPDLNRRPFPYHGNALPSELRRPIYSHCIKEKYRNLSWLNTTMFLFLGLAAKQPEGPWNQKVALRSRTQKEEIRGHCCPRHALGRRLSTGAWSAAKYLSCQR